MWTRPVSASGDADAAGHVVGQARIAPIARTTSSHGQGDEEQGQHDGEDAEESGGGVVDRVPGLAGNLEPLAQRDNDRRGERATKAAASRLTCESVAFQARARHRHRRDRRAAKEACQEAGLRRLRAWARAWADLVEACPFWRAGAREPYRTRSVETIVP